MARKFLHHLKLFKGWVTGFTFGAIEPADLGTGTPDANKVLYGDGRWDDGVLPRWRRRAHGISTG